MHKSCCCESRRTEKEAKQQKEIFVLTFEFVIEFVASLTTAKFPFPKKFHDFFSHPMIFFFASTNDVAFVFVSLIKKIGIFFRMLS